MSNELYVTVMSTYPRVPHLMPVRHTQPDATPGGGQLPNGAKLPLYANRFRARVAPTTRRST